MTHNSAARAISAELANIFYTAWPCYVHYLDPSNIHRFADPPGWEDATELITALEQLEPCDDTYQPLTLPMRTAISEEITKGNERHVACLSLAVALTRTIPSVFHAVLQGEWNATPNAHDSVGYRDAIADAFARRAAGPVDQVQFDLTMAALTQPEEQPTEVNCDWQYMVRLTGLSMGGVCNALDEMPMRCFVDRDAARAWAFAVCVGECDLLCDPGLMRRSDYRAVMEEVAAFQQPSQTWLLPTTANTLRITSRSTPWQECSAAK